MTVGGSLCGGEEEEGAEAGGGVGDVHEGGVGEGVNAEHGEGVGLGEDGGEVFGDDAVGECEVAWGAFHGGNLGGGVDVTDLCVYGLTFAGCPIVFADTGDGAAGVEEEGEGLIARADIHHEATVGVTFACEGNEIAAGGGAPVVFFLREVKGEGEGVEDVHAHDAVQRVGFVHHAAHAREVHHDAGVVIGFAWANLKVGGEELGALGGVATELHLAGVNPLHAFEFFCRTRMQHGVGGAGVKHHLNGLAINKAGDQNLFATRVLGHAHKVDFRARLGGKRRALRLGRRGVRNCHREAEQGGEGGAECFHAKMVAHCVGNCQCF